MVGVLPVLLGGALFVPDVAESAVFSVLGCGGDGFDGLACWGDCGFAACGFL